jgi:hypothetical protein
MYKLSSPGCPSWLRVRGPEVVDDSGTPVLLRGFCVGGFMNMENFINGYPGQESSFRSAVAGVLGAGKAAFFFDRLLDNFLASDDILHMANIGANCLRVPVSYRHFEDDLEPFSYREAGFRRLDQVIAECRKWGIWVIIDLHSAPGWQNPDWHSDNPGAVAHLWTQEVFQARLEGLWKEFARRYRHEPAVAGYNLINEPVCPVPGALPKLYARLAKAIRTIDRKHMLFAEGNWFSTNFTEIDPEMDPNTVFSTHNYAAPSFSSGPYPGVVKGGWGDGQRYDKDRLKKEFEHVTAFARKNRVPNWVGEFGSIYPANWTHADRLRVVSDQLDIFNSAKNHWTIWTYKDIGMMGTVTVNPDSEWMRRTSKVRALKDALGVDTWGQKTSVAVQAVDRLARDSGNAFRKAGVKFNEGSLRFESQRMIAGLALSNALAPAFAEQFRGMTEKAIARMLESFAWRNCTVRTGLEEVIARHC